MACADVTVLQYVFVLIRSFEFEQFDVRSGTTAHHCDAQLGTRMDTEFDCHPITFWVIERSSTVQRLTAEHINEERFGVVQIGDRHRDVIDVTSGRNPLTSILI
jgi:hypothetical protein